MLTISAQSVLLAGATGVYLMVVGGLLLKRSLHKFEARIPRPFITMLQIAIASGVVFALASVPSYVARIVSSEVLPFIMPYTPILFAVSFIACIQKLESSRGGRYQAAVALWLAALISAAFIAAQVLVRSVWGV